MQDNEQPAVGQAQTGFVWTDAQAAILRKGGEIMGGVPSIQAVEPLDQLPGQKLPYYLRSGEGERLLVGSMVVNLIARGSDTGDLYEWAVITGGKRASFPAHTHGETHELVFMLDGEVELQVGDRTYRMIKGDFASIPPATVHGFRMNAHRTQLLSITSSSHISTLYHELGEPYAGYVQPGDAVAPLSDQALIRISATTDTTFQQAPLTGQPERVTNTTLPTTIVPYVLAAGEGDRYIIVDQLFTILSDNATTGGKLVFAGTEGPAGDMIIRHFHQRHSEAFFCVDGQMRMRANESLLDINPGDYVSIPAGVIHAYQLKSHYTRFVGVLTPGIFEEFFRSATPFTDHVYPQVPGPGPNFKRIMELQLDLVPLERPPFPPGAPH